MASFSTDLAPWVVLMIMVGSALWATRQICQSLTRIAGALDQIRAVLAKRN